MKYVFRLSSDVMAKLNVAAPPRKHGRSALIRQALVDFLCKPKQPLADRPHLRGRDNPYQKVCAILDEEQIDAIKKAYPDVSVSVVIQAAVASELRKARYKIDSLPTGKTSKLDSTPNDKEENTNDYSCSRSTSGELTVALN